jgi:hypothetical protein
MVLRVTYVNYFAMCLDNVPANLPHENGRLWWGAIKHVLMPRLFFPNKASINDSDRTSYYTGVMVAGEESGTSISIGYMGESYIDFGMIGMFIPVLLLGMFYGGVYRYFAQGRRLILLGFAIATTILVFGAYSLETSNIKVLGGNLTALIVFGLFAWLGAPLVWRWITSAGGLRPPQPGVTKPMSANRLPTKS